MTADIGDPRARNWQFSLRALFIGLFVLAILLSIYTSRETIGVWFMGSPRWKTEFSASDVEILKQAMPIELPPSAIIDYGRYGHGGGSDIFIQLRLKMPEAEASVFRQRVAASAHQPLVAPDSDWPPREVDDREWIATRRETDTDFELSPDIQYVFCKPQSGVVTVYVDLFRSNDGQGANIVDATGVFHGWHARCSPP